MSTPIWSMATACRTGVVNSLYKNWMTVRGPDISNDEHTSDLAMLPGDFAIVAQGGPTLNEITTFKAGDPVWFSSTGCRRQTSLYWFGSGNEFLSSEDHGQPRDYPPVRMSELWSLPAQSSEVWSRATIPQCSLPRTPFPSCQNTQFIN